MCVTCRKEGRKIMRMKQTERWKDRESNKENNKQSNNDTERWKTKEGRKEEEQNKLEKMLHKAQKFSASNCMILLNAMSKMEGVVVYLKISIQIFPGGLRRRKRSPQPRTTGNTDGICAHYVPKANPKLSHHFNLLGRSCNSITPIVCAEMSKTTVIN